MNIDNLSYLELKKLQKKVKKAISRKAKREAIAFAYADCAAYCKNVHGVSLEYSRTAYYFRD